MEIVYYQTNEKRIWRKETEMTLKQDLKELKKEFIHEEFLRPH
jgi:hypothetical protein